MKTEEILDPTPGLTAAIVMVILGILAIVAFAFGNAAIVGGIILIISMFITPGFIIVNPNEARVLTLFGKYVGSIKKDGFFWVNPFTVKRKVSLKAYNLNGQQLKVNDSVGNPIEIAAVIVWQIKDTAKAVFAVENYLQYVNIQSEAAVRHLANSFPYDNIEDETASITLRGGADQVSEMLEKELNERLDRAGIEVLEARISHLAYAPEIAHTMLQRQQASAIISARRLIVEGAVGMVEMALQRLSEKNIVDLDEERKAAMVSNLLVVLCGDKSVNPIVNTGTLYH
jgi:regulator of protease activity HflC (stomatin/prohibitin superfamily)